VFDANIQAIERSDALVAYLTSYDCIGSIFEITFAQDRGIPTFLLFAPNVDALEFWVPSIRAKRMRGLPSVTSEADLPGALHAIVHDLRRRRT
jgi:nucleoside 2-deoxyribosyltransferase